MRIYSVLQPSCTIRQSTQNRRLFSIINSHLFCSWRKHLNRPVRNKVCRSLHNYSCSPIIRPNLCWPSTQPQRTIGIICTPVSVSPVPVSLPLGTIPALWYSANSYQSIDYSSNAAQFNYSRIVSPLDYGKFCLIPTPRLPLPIL